jgi:hypothetical protein
MRFMIIRKADALTEAGALPTKRLIEAMGRYMDEMEKAGIALGGDGLHPSAKSARVKFAAGKSTVTDGPFAETKELIAGYGLIEVRSMAEAIEWARRWPAIDGDADVELEIRPVFEASDFPAGLLAPGEAERVEARRTRPGEAAPHGR